MKINGLLINKSVMSSAEFILIQRSLATCDHEPSTVEELIAYNEKDMSGSWDAIATNFLPRFWQDTTVTPYGFSMVCFSNRM